MKTLSYGDEIENAEVGTSNLELLISDDKLSANSVNRILQNLYEDNEYNYTLIQNLIKNIYGREDGILPNILEEFKEVRILESGTGSSYFRIPFGAINLMQPHYKDAGMSHGLSYSGVEGDDEKKIVNTEFIDDGFDTYTIFNKPKLSIAKRQIADYINLDIADLDNNIKIYAKKFDNKEQLKNSFVHRVANSSEGRAEIETFGKDSGTNADGTINIDNKLEQLSFPFVGYYASITENTVGAVDSSIYKANTETVNFPNIGQDTTWIVVFRGANGFTTPETDDNRGNYPLKFSFFEYTNGTEIARDSYLPSIDTFVDTQDTTKEEQINSIVSDINVSYKDYYSAEKINVELLNDDGIATSYPALSITSKINYSDLTNNVRLAITTNNELYDPINNPIKVITKTNSDNQTEDTEYYYSPNLGDFYTTTVKSIAQDYYYDSISLLTGIFSKYSSYVVNENLSKKEFALEEITDFAIPSHIDYPQDSDISSDEFKYFVYLNTDIDGKYDKNSSRLDKYVSTSKMFGSVLCSSLEQKFTETDVYKYVIGKEHRDKPIALFEVYVKFDNSSGKSMPFIDQEKSKCLFPVLDPNKINTRAAGLNNLLVDTNTKIQNQFYYSDKGIKDYTETEDGEGFKIKWEANPETHANPDAGNPDGNILEARAIKACVSNGRNELSVISDENHSEALNAGVDDTIETFAPYIYNHSQDGKTKEVIANKYGKRIKLLDERKLRIEQQQTRNNYNDLNLFEVTKNGFLFQRNENWEGEEKQKNHLQLKNLETNDGFAKTATSEMKSRDSGILISSENYIDNEEVDTDAYNAVPNDKENYFKLYANNNKTWIKGISGKLTVAANKNEGTSPDIILENKPINYFDFAAIYGNINTTENSANKGEINEAAANSTNNSALDNRGKVFTKSSENKGNKYLRVKGNFIIGNEVENDTETKVSLDTPYVAIFNADTFLKGKFNVASLNDESRFGDDPSKDYKNYSSFTIEKDKIFASNYNDFWLSGNYKNERKTGSTNEGRYSLRLRNVEGFEFRKIKEGCASTADLNVASSLTLNDNHVYASFKDVAVSGANNAVRHFIELRKDVFHINMDSDFDAVYKIENRVVNGSNETKENIFTLKTSNKYGSITLKTKTADTETKLFANVRETILDSDTVYIGRFPASGDGYEGVDYAYNNFEVDGGYKKGNLKVRGLTTLGPANTPKERNTLQIYGATFIGAKTDNGYTSEGIALNEDGEILDYSLFVGGITTMRGNLSVEGDTGILGDLNVDEGTDVHGTLDVSGNMSISQDLHVGGTTTLNINGGETNVYQDVTIEKSLTVKKEAEIDKKLFVNNTAYFNTDGGGTVYTTTVERSVKIGDLVVNGAATIGTDVDEEGNSLNNGFLQIRNQALFNASPVDSNHDVTSVGGLVSISENLMVNGTTVVGSSENGTLLVGRLITNSSEAQNIEIGESLIDSLENATYITKGKMILKAKRDGADNPDTTVIEGGAVQCTYVQTSSSRAKKKNIVHSERNAVKAINDIEIVDFFYKNDKNDRNQKVGFIAEDTDSIFSTNNKDCMDHSNCIGMLLKAIQELSAEIEELKKNK